MLILLHYVNVINKVMMMMMVTTSYRSSIDTIALNCLVYEKIAFCVLATDGLTDRPTDKQMDMPIVLSRSRCREQRLNKVNTDLYSAPSRTCTPLMRYRSRTSALISAS